MNVKIIAALTIIGLASCKKGLVEKYENSQETAVFSEVKSMSDLKVPAGFNWATTKTIQVNIQLKDSKDEAVKGASIYLMNDGYVNGGKVVLSGALDANGEFNASIEVPAFQNEIVINSSYKGIPEDILVHISGNTAIARLGGSKPAPLNTVQSKEPIPTALGKSSGNKFNVLPSSRTWTSGTDGGVPNYLETPNDFVSSTLLAQINTALPSGRAVPSNSPLLAENGIRVIKVTQLAEVFVTFVSEGASYKNALFYYTYNENNPPASLEAITNYTVVFPNTSFSGSGGGLLPGHKVKLGVFPAGTVIGYGIAANGWKGNSEGFNGVTNGLWTVFGEKQFNPETNPSLKQHMVLLNDAANHRIVMGFEDIKRDLNNCDHDFNDVMFYTTSNPFNAIDDEDITPLPPVTDTDEDGVDDTEDDYPTDPNKAFNNYTGTGSVAFEDQWPSTGDYDLNDVVMNYSYNVITNAQNKVVRVEGNTTLRATGGAFQNGFGIQFPVERAKVSNVSGATLEAGQNKAVLVLFQNMRQEMVSWNTIRGGSTSASKNYSLSFDISNGPSLSQFGLGVYNPFIWNGSMGRGYEIHLPGKQPTDLANPTAFGTGRDGSNVQSGDTYVSKTNRLPWAIQTPANFSYPVEKADINSAYTKFASWVQSGGSLFGDWYLPNSGYRNSENIY
ncbi:MAG: LruC domain-containing protein [Bacteroidetes bacterium]|nr:LruC domain-containing protein [Bacteroidota bacterium]